MFPDCDGGDKENSMRSHQIPVDFYSAGVHCAQCSVHIADPWYEKLNTQPITEQRRLEKRDLGNSSFSRLACCVQVRPELNEMIVVVGDNLSGNSHDWMAGDDRDF